MRTNRPPNVTANAILRSAALRAVLVALLLATPAAAQNLLTNPDFASTTNAWTFTGPGSLALGTDDANGSGASRSAVVTNTGSPSAGGTFAGIQQCVSAGPGKGYSWAFASHVPPSQASDTANRVGIRVEFFPLGGCGGTALLTDTSTRTFDATFEVQARLFTPLVSPNQTASARVSVGVFKYSGSATLSGTFDALHFGEADVVTRVIPASASVAGQNGAFFRTALWAVNGSRNRSSPIRVEFRCASGSACDGSASPTVPPGGTRYFDDAVNDVARPSVAGAIEVTYDRNYAPFTVSTRTYSPSLDGPSTGSTLPALPLSDARTRSLLVALAASTNPATGFRTNVGVYNPGATDASATITVFGESGLALGSPVAVSAPSRRPVQVNDVVAQTGAPSNGTAFYAVVDSTAPVFSYATVIDNQSADSMIVTGAPPATTAASTNLLQNADFTTNTAGWTVSGSGSLGWNAEGDDQIPGNVGSLSVVNTTAAANQATYATQCFSVTPGRIYTVRFSYRAPLGQSGDPNNFPTMTADYFSGPGCTGSTLGATALGSVGIGSSPSNRWDASVSFGYLPAPANAVSGIVRLGGYKRNAGGSFEMRFDTVYVGESAQTILVVPASASIHGANGTFFQTDLWGVLYGATRSTPWTMHFRCLSSPSCDLINGTTFYKAGSSVKFSNVVGGSIGRPEQAGAIELETDPGFAPVSFLTRTYSPALPAPTTGSQIPALPLSEARTESVLVGLGASSDGSRGFRTNVGAYNPGTASGNVTVTLYDAGGAPIGSPYTTSIAPRRPIQVNNVFQAAGAGTATGNAYSAVVSSTVNVISYATVIDNQSADSVIVIGAPH